jgi:MoxR-like ATPase
MTRVRAEIARAIVGQEAVVEQLLLGLLARGHVLLLGVPGLAKTLLVQSLARTLGLAYGRVQFTPDLMPSDVTGTEILIEDKATGQREFRFVPGPIFANVVLGDEINRTPPRTQAALLEAMQERQITVAGRRHELPRPFYVLATQNPIEQEGTYPLPEAQLDRFMLNVVIGYPSEAEERAVVERTTGDDEPTLSTVVTSDELLRYQSVTRKMPVGEHVVALVVDLVRRSRPDNNAAPRIVKDYVTWGAGPRGAQHLLLAAKARATLYGEYCVAKADVAAVALPVLRHRLITNFKAETDGVRTDDVVAELLRGI